MNTKHASPDAPLNEQLLHETLLARRRVYDHGSHTPMDTLHFPAGGQLHLKREDLSPMHAYKWRGAFNKIAKLLEKTTVCELVAASAGNHAQGVALGAARFGIHATVFLPEPTPKMKVDAVRSLGGNFVEPRLVGDTVDESLGEARRYAAAAGAHFIHPFDDIDIIAGQATIADEVVMSGCGEIHTAFLQIGGGGMAAGVASWLRRFFPDIRIVGVEGVGQASMKRAIERGKPERLESLDVFCDGTAVRRAGDITWRLCKDLIDEIVTVTNSEVCAAIEFLWEHRRIIPEPAGAMGVAAWLKSGPGRHARTSLCVICGGNMDFAQFSTVVRQAAIGSRTRRFVRFRLPEKAGALHHLVKSLRRSVNIIEFQYGRNHPETAYPVIGFDADAGAWDALQTEWRTSGQWFEEVTGRPEVDARVIPFDTRGLDSAVFCRVEFPERAGALSDFLGHAGETASICYFNYSFTGERVGRAILGLLFRNDNDRRAWRARMETDCAPLRLYEEIDLFLPDRDGRPDTVAPLRP